MSAHRRARGSVAPGSRQTGFTLIELLVVVIVLGGLAVAISQVLLSTLRDSQNTIYHLDSSDSAFLTDARFQDDISLADKPDPGSLPADWTSTTATISRGQTGCGGTASALRIMSPGATTGSVQIISYTVSSASLQRMTCSGSTIAAATAATPAAIVVVPGLSKSVANPVVVTCRATAAGDPVSNDNQCRLVTMTVTTGTGYVFSVAGLRDTADASIGSPRVVHQCTLLASANANTYENEPTTNFNDHDDYGGAGRTYIENRGDGSNNTVNGGHAAIRGYLQFDLTSACQDTADGEPPFMPPGKVLTGATLDLVYENATHDTGDHLCDGNHIGYVLSQPWDPTTLTWNSQVNLDLDVDPITTVPSGQTSSRHGDTGKFAWTTLGNWGSNSNYPQSFNVLTTVNHWYAGAPATGVGDWQNDGWVITTPTNSCDHLESYKWASKGSNDANSPRLVITWTE